MENLFNNFDLATFWPFVMSHSALFAGLVVVLGVILVFEIKAKAGNAKVIDTQMAIEWINRHEAVVIDIRDKEAFRKGHIINAQSVEPAHVLEKLEFYKNKPLIVVCAQGISAQKTAALLKKEGLEQVAILKGGIQAWVDADLPLEK